MLFVIPYHMNGLNQYFQETHGEYLLRCPISGSVIWEPSPIRWHQLCQGGIPGANQPEDLIGLLAPKSKVTENRTHKKTAGLGTRRDGKTVFTLK